MKTKTIASICEALRYLDLAKDALLEVIREAEARQRKRRRRKR